MHTERIQKVLAAAGFGSRRACEQLVLDGRVTVNDQRVTALPVLVDPRRDRTAVDGRTVRSQRLVYFLLNKPPGVLCTHNDPDGRKRAVDLLTGVRERVFPVGRLDSESIGLLLLTNDGELTQRLTHPRFGVPKTYRAEVDGVPSEETLDRVRAGVWLSDGRTAPAKIEIVHRQRDRCMLEITLGDNRNREIRRMLAKFGHKVRRLTRIRMGKLSIARLPVGAFRPLTVEEVLYLRKLAAGATRGAADIGARGFTIGTRSRQHGRPLQASAGGRQRGRDAGPPRNRSPRFAEGGGVQMQRRNRANRGRRMVLPEE